MTEVRSQHKEVSRQSQILLYQEEFQVATDASRSQDTSHSIRQAQALSQDKVTVSCVVAAEQEKKENIRFQKQLLQKAPLPNSSARTFGQEQTDNNFIALMREIQVLLTDNVRKIWRTFWDMGAKTMDQSLKMSVLKADAQVKASEYQAEQIKMDSQKEMATAIVSGVATIALIGMGVKGAMDAAKEKTANIALREETKVAEEATKADEELAAATKEAEKATMDATEAQFSEESQKVLNKAKEKLQLAQQKVDLFENEAKVTQAGEDVKAAEAAEKDATTDSEREQCKKTRVENEFEYQTRQAEFNRDYNKYVEKLPAGERGNVPTTLQKLKRAATKGTATLGQHLSNALHSAMQNLQGIQVPMTLAQSSFSAKYDGDKSIAAGLEGQQHGESTILDGQMQYLGQDLGRIDDLRSQFSQFLDGAIQQGSRNIDSHTQVMMQGMR